MRILPASFYFVAFSFAAGVATGDQPEAKLTSLEVAPAKIQLQGAWSTQSLSVLGCYSDGSMRDATRQVAYTSAASNIATVDATGIVRPVADGETKLTASITVDSTPITAEMSVTVAEFGNSPVDFVNHVAPTLNRLGCNAAKCHGAQKGQGEFKLSMFGVWPQRDVTLDASFHAPNERILQLRDDGALEAVGYGEAVVVTTYLHKSCVLRVAVPQSLPFAFPEIKPHNKIDEHVLAKLKQLGIPPAELCSDHEFLRRVYLDVTGTLPTSDEARNFLADKDAAKRGKLIDRLLAVPQAMAAIAKAATAHSEAQKVATAKRQLADQAKKNFDDLVAKQKESTDQEQASVGEQVAAATTAQQAAEKAANAKLAEADKRLVAAQAIAKGVISLSAESLPPGVTLKGAKISADQNQATVTLAVSKKAPVGVRYNIVISGTIRASGETITRIAPAIPIRVLAAQTQK